MSEMDRERRFGSELHVSDFLERLSIPLVRELWSGVAWRMKRCFVMCAVDTTYTMITVNTFCTIHALSAMSHCEQCTHRIQGVHCI